jgi:hypothetical protein
LLYFYNQAFLMDVHQTKTTGDCHFEGAYCKARNGSVNRY